MKYSVIDSAKYVFGSISRRDKWLYTLTFAPFAIGFVVQSYFASASGVPTSGDKLLWEWLLVAFLAVWIFLLVTLNSLGKERELRERLSAQAETK